MEPLDETHLLSAPDAPAPVPALDLDAVGRDLADVEVALTRLDTGTYWTDEVTGIELPASLLEANPTARRAHTSAQ